MLQEDAQRTCGARRTPVMATGRLPTTVPLQP
jgi:hypothetical protein